MFLLSKKINQKVILIDEFDKSFHFELSKALIDIFHKSSKENQFIFSSHNLNLMNHNLRDDQIWLTEKNDIGTSELFLIVDFDNLKTFKKKDNITSQYLNGIFGAYHIINNAQNKEGLKYLEKNKDEKNTK
ncbi:AAA family ATPase [Mesomycoplasma neurolyticum]|uniref:ATPase AAA-type core domain-containing protein n=1 Tax=Mesomycoplasma neurolyticum TaxID=2120 RepID=A0A449A4Q3_9BACT|nr:AAA family ATPase [Mesomycoplasma neurolyticum]VEU59225.1 Uncharacterised protein [Mesomycoplasma neurolyticum]